MTDIALLWSNKAFGADFFLEAGQLATDDGLRTAIQISLFSDARARDDDVLPDGTGDRRGWWGDAFAADEGDRIGSRLWLLSREKVLARVLVRARDYAREALAWLIADGVVSKIEVDVELRGRDQLAIGVAITRPDGPARQRFDYVWERSL